MKDCALCQLPARAYCESDQASLCWDCDAKVHGTNFLVARHSRTLLCRLCYSLSPWNASGAKLGHTVSVCHSCVHQQNPVRSEESDAGNDDDDDEIRTEDDDDDFGQEDGENQVVPWSTTATPPPATSSSSSEESVMTRFSFKRMRPNALDSTQEEFNRSPSQQKCGSPLATQGIGSRRDDEVTSVARNARSLKDSRTESTKPFEVQVPADSKSTVVGVLEKLYGVTQREDVDVGG